MEPQLQTWGTCVQSRDFKRVTGQLVLGKEKKKTDNRMVVHTSKIFKTYSQHHGTMRMSERFWFDLVGATLCTADISHSKREV